MLQELAPCACGTRCGGSSAFSLLSFPAAGEEGASSPYGVDCTLSLGTPSTRRAEARVLVTARVGAASSCKEPGVPARRRRCANCDTTSTPLWRNGPQGPKSLCNACGIRYKKEERRAAAAARTTQDGGLVGSYACGAYARQRQHQHNQHPPPQWGCYGSSAAAYGYGDNNSARAADGKCLSSWMLNVMPSSLGFTAVRDRHSTLFQYY